MSDLHEELTQEYVVFRVKRYLEYSQDEECVENKVTLDKKESIVRKVEINVV